MIYGPLVTICVTLVPGPSCFTFINHLLIKIWLKTLHLPCQSKINKIMKSKTKILPEHHLAEDGGTNKPMFEINNVMPCNTILMHHWIDYCHKL